LIQVSDIAAMAILEALAASGVKPDKGLRLKREGMGFSLSIDTPADNDTITYRSKSMVLIVNRGTEEEVGDALVDVEDGPEEAHLVLRYKIPSAP
jgi:hypothetical protein